MRSAMTNGVAPDYDNHGFRSAEEETALSSCSASPSADDDGQDSDQPDTHDSNALGAEVDVWGTSDGYTPLNLLSGSGEAKIMMSMGPSDSESYQDDGEFDDALKWNTARIAPESVCHEETVKIKNDRKDSRIIFFDASSLGFGNKDKTFFAGESDNDEDQHSENVTSSGIAHGESFQYAEIADTLLSSLDEEYGITMEKPTSAGDKNMNQGNDCPKKYDKEINSKLPSDRGKTEDENRIIAAAIDEALKARSGDRSSHFETNWGSTEDVESPHDCCSSQALPPTENEGRVHSTNAGKLKTDADCLKIDSQAVHKAMKNISTTNSALLERFNAWQENDLAKTKAVRKSHKHQIISDAPLRAFFRTTPKAIQATALLTRSATLAEAIIRLENCNMLKIVEGLLTIHIIGADHIECSSVSRLQSLFCPLIRWIGSSTVQRATEIKRIELVLIGRELGDGNNIPASNCVDLMPSSQNLAGGVQSATAICHAGMYHTWMEEQRPGIPNFAIAFNAGVWGYSSWMPTVEYLTKITHGSVPFVVTAYTLPEAQEDYSVIESLADADERLMWEPSENVFGSKKKRETKSRTEVYRENAAWQCWLMGDKRAHEINGAIKLNI